MLQNIYSSPPTVALRVTDGAPETTNRGLQDVVAAVEELQYATTVWPDGLRALLLEKDSQVSTKSLSGLDDLWSQNLGIQHTANYLSAMAKQLSVALLDICEKLLHHPILAEGAVPPPDLVVATMRTIRWSARWSWLRHEQPAPSLWESAISLYGRAERWEFQWFIGQEDIAVTSSFLSLSSRNFWRCR